MMKVARGAFPSSGHKVTPVVHPLHCLVNAGSCSEGRGKGGRGGKSSFGGDNHNITPFNYESLVTYAIILF